MQRGGAGTELTYVGGSLYLAGPYNGAPLSVVAITFGPFDLGTIAGIPLRVRDIRVDVERPRFTLNPSGCEAFQVRATLWGGGADPFSVTDDSPVSRSSRFQAANCARLGFKPRLLLALRGGTKRGDHPKLHAVLKTKQGPESKTPEANIAGAVVRLPRSAFLDQAHIGTVCTRVQFAANACPSRSVYGHASVKTPLLDEVLSGPVYLRSSNNELPDLVIALKGPDSLPLEVQLAGRVDSVKGSIRTSFDSVPDAPVTQFTLNMLGGQKGLIVNSRNLCVRPSRVKLKLTGQNGRISQSRPLLKVDCKRPKK